MTCLASTTSVGAKLDEFTRALASMAFKLDCCASILPRVSKPTTPTAQNRPHQLTGCFRKPAFVIHINARAFRGTSGIRVCKTTKPPTAIPSNFKRFDPCCESSDVSSMSSILKKFKGTLKRFLVSILDRFSTINSQQAATAANEAAPPLVKVTSISRVGLIQAYPSSPPRRISSHVYRYPPR